MHIIFILLLVAHVFLCLFLVLLVLLQNDKGGGLAGAFGGLGGGAAFTGGSTATFLTTLTTWVAAISFAVIIGLNFLSTKATQARRTESELKSAHKGLSSVLPPGVSVPTAPTPVSGGAIPGLGGASEVPGASSQPATAPAGNGGMGTPGPGSTGK